MADAKIVKQWLAMDAAFGVTEVPLARPARRAAAAVTPARAAGPAPGQYFQPAAHPITAPGRGGNENAAGARASAPAPGPPHAPAGPVHGPTPERAFTPRPGAASPSLTPRPTTEPTMPKPRKPPVFIPPPAGLIADLPPLSDAQKAQKLAALKTRVQQELPKFFSDVSTKVVFGEGSPVARLVFIGEGPGVEEDLSGRPFVGRSGQLLTKMIGAMKLSREQVYICNVVKLRSAEHNALTNKITDCPPTPEEVARDIGYLHEQLEIIRPEVIVTLGAPAMVYITGETEGITKVRGHWRLYRGIPVMPTFHPSYVLRAYSEDNRKKVWSDLQQVIAKLGIK